MAISIDSVYQKVLVLANKEQRGYITPQEFNLFADKAQKEIIRHYFHDIKTAFWKKKSETESLDDLEIVQEKLAVFRRQISKECIVQTTEDGRNLVLIPLPSNFNKLAMIYLKASSSTNGVYPEITRVDKNDLLNMQANPLTKPDLDRPVYCHSNYPGYYEVYPMKEYDGPTNWSVQQNVGVDQNTDTITTITTYALTNNYNGVGGNHYATPSEQGALPKATGGDDVLIDYWKKPTKPVWGYVVVNQKALYNSNTSVDFELHELEEETLVAKILELAGITIEKPQVTKLAMVSGQQTKKEQND